jgi:predicted phosphohydrolase
MRFQLFSDFHLEFVSEYPRIPPKAEIIVFAGDIGHIADKHFKDFINYCSENWTHVIYVMGNHEFYCRRSMDTIIHQFSTYFAEFSNVHLLNNTSIEIDGVVIYGFTGWTKSIFNSWRVAQEHLNDYECIHTTTGKYTPEIQNKLSNEQINLFKQFIETTESNNIMIVTHFPPISDGTSSQEFNNSHLKKYYTWNNLLDELSIDSEKMNKIKIWCSGHTHWSYDLNVNNIRYIGNQIGYIGENIPFTSEAFEV